MNDFSDVAHQYTPMIHHIIRSLSIYKEKDEYFQIGLIALWEAYQKFDPQLGNFLNFSYTIVKGRILNELKRQQRIDIPAHILEERKSYDNLLEIEILLTYTEGLTPKQSRWLIHTYRDGCSINEIAKYYKVTPSAVKSWKKAALHKLKRNISTTP